MGKIQKIYLSETDRREYVRQAEVQKQAEIDAAWAQREEEIRMVNYIMRKKKLDEADWRDLITPEYHEQ